MSANAELSELIGLVYEAGLAPDRWSQVLRAAAGFVDADAGLLGIGSSRRPSAGLAVPLTLEVDPHYQRLWVESYLEADVWWREFSRRFEEGVLTAAQCVDPHALRRTAIYNEVLVHAGVEDGLFAGIARVPGADAIAAFYRGRRRRSFGPREARRLRALLPHLQRAVRINDALGLLESQRDAHRVAGELTSVGLLQLDAHGRVLAANRHAERRLLMGQPLTLRGGILGASSRRADEALAAAVARALPGASPRTGSTVSLGGLPGSMSLVVHVAPVPHDGERPRFCEGEERTEAVVLVVSREDLAGWSAREAAHLLHLTPAEAELALALARGEDLACHAEQRGITRETARWRMKQVLQKTGSRRQSDVVRLVLTTLGRLAGETSAP